MYLRFFGQDNISGYHTLWEKKHSVDPHQDPRAVYATTQSHKKHPCMTSVAGPMPKMPLFTKSGTPRLWSPMHNRWLTAKEKAASMGVPSTPELAKAARMPEALVQPMPAAGRWHQRVGNGFFIPNIGMAVCAVLAKIRFRSTVATGAAPLSETAAVATGTAPNSETAVQSLKVGAIAGGKIDMELVVQGRFFDVIASCEKVYEGRIRTAKLKALKPGSVIAIKDSESNQTVLTEVSGPVESFDTFHAMLAGLAGILPV